MADDLGRLLGTARVVMYAGEPHFDADYRVLLDIREFERVADGDVVLRAQWTIAAIDGGTAAAVEEADIAQPVASSAWDDIVAAESAALGSLTRRIAERIAALPPR